MDNLQMGAQAAKLVECNNVSQALTSTLYVDHDIEA